MTPQDGGSEDDEAAFAPMSEGACVFPTLLVLYHGRLPRSIGAMSVLAACSTALQDIHKDERVQGVETAMLVPVQGGASGCGAPR